MQWHDLLFMHWAVDAARLEALLPDGLEIDRYEDRAYIGVIPFGMRRVRSRYLPALPWLSRFPELNVRTYVKAGDTSGVWFFSLEAANPVAVRTARSRFHLPYFDARMSMRSHSSGWIAYRSERRHRGAPPAQFEGRYRPTADVSCPEVGSLEAFLTGRYRLFAADPDGRLYRGEIDHGPWPLQPAEAEIEVNTMLEPLGMSIPDAPPLLHFARELDVVAWKLVAVNAPDAQPDPESPRT
jgi:uncharacterized protein YqjF (DUF2071 family)